MYRIQSLSLQIADSIVELRSLDRWPTGRFGATIPANAKRKAELPAGKLVKPRMEFAKRWKSYDSLGTIGFREILPRRRSPCMASLASA